jgi:DNA-binding FrmR family transcriptional regulator
MPQEVVAMTTVDGVLSVERRDTDKASNTATPCNTGRKDEQLSRLRKIEGQVRGVTRMVDQDRNCIDVITQISAATRAVHEVALSLLDDHIRHACCTRPEPTPVTAQ